MMERINSRELTEWIAYWQIEPWGEERADYRSGMIASVIANVNRGKGGRRYKPQDFMPKFGLSKKQKPVKEMRNIFLQASSAFKRKQDYGQHNSRKISGSDVGQDGLI